MKNYRYDKVDENKFSVIEIPSELVVKFASTKEDAKEIVRKLNGGQAFNGWTPPFFVKELHQ